jgi:hypothetical protein
MAARQLLDVLLETAGMRAQPLAVPALPLEIFGPQVEGAVLRFEGRVLAHERLVLVVQLAIDGRVVPVVGRTGGELRRPGRPPSS